MTSLQSARNVATSTREETIDLINNCHIAVPEREEAELYERDQEWLKKNRTELLKQYDETWIAVYDGAVIQSHRNLDKLAEALRAQHVKPTGAVIHYLTTREFSMLL